MNRKKIIRAVGLALLPAMFLSLFGCARKGSAPNSEIVSVSYSCGHMVNTSSFSFWLRESEGEILFDADFFLEEADEYRKISFSEVKVEAEDMKELKKIDEKYNFLEFLLKNKPKKSRFVIMDETMYGFCVKWDDGTILTTNRNMSFSNELRDFFVSLSRKYYVETLDEN